MEPVLVQPGTRLEQQCQALSLDNNQPRLTDEIHMIIPAIPNVNTHVDDNAERDLEILELREVISQLENGKRLQLLVHEKYIEEKETLISSLQEQISVIETSNQSRIRELDLKLSEAIVGRNEVEMEKDSLASVLNEAIKNMESKEQGIF